MDIVHTIRLYVTMEDADASHCPECDALGRTTRLQAGVLSRRVLLAGLVQNGMLLQAGPLIASVTRVVLNVDDKSWTVSAQANCPPETVMATIKELETLGWQGE